MRIFPTDIGMPKSPPFSKGLKVNAKCTKTIEQNENTVSRK